MITRFHFSQFVYDRSTQWTVCASDVILYFVLVLKPLGGSAAVSSLNNKNAPNASPLLPSLHLHHLHRQIIVMDLHGCTNASWHRLHFWFKAAITQVLCSCSRLHGGARVLCKFFSFYCVLEKTKAYISEKQALHLVKVRGNGKEKVFLIFFFFFFSVGAN